MNTEVEGISRLTGWAVEECQKVLDACSGSVSHALFFIRMVEQDRHERMDAQAVADSLYDVVQAHLLTTD